MFVTPCNYFKREKANIKIIQILIFGKVLMLLLIFSFQQCSFCNLGDVKNILQSKNYCSPIYI